MAQPVKETAAPDPRRNLRPSPELVQKWLDWILSQPEAVEELERQSA